MEQQIEIIQSNVQTMSVGTIAQFTVEEGIYDLQCSGIELYMINGAVPVDSLIYSRKDYAPGWSDASIYVDSEDPRFTAQNLTALQQLYYYNKSYKKVNETNLLAISGANNKEIITNYYGDDQSVNGIVYYPFNKFFPGFSERYLVVEKFMRISIQCSSLDDILLLKVEADDDPLLIAGQKYPWDITTVRPILVMKRTFGLDMASLRQMKKSFITSTTQTGQHIANKTFTVMGGDLSQYTGFLVQNTIQTSITNGDLTRAYCASVNLTKNNLDIINANSYDLAIAQANSLKSDQNNDSNTFSGMLYHDTQNNTISYTFDMSSEGNVDDNANVQITFLFQRIR